MTPFPLPEEVARISALPDPVLRNLHITQGYHEISNALLELMPGFANWCSYACWASRQAGQTIRREDLSNAVDRHLERADFLNGPEGRLIRELAVPVTELRRTIGDAIRQTGVMARTSAAVAEGNVKVFQEIGAVCSRFIVVAREQGQRIAEMEEEELAERIGPLTVGPPPDGQSMLTRAFGCYAKAVGSTDPRDRAEWILFGSLNIGVHEQMRLQPEIEASTSSAVPDLEKLQEYIGARLPIGRGRIFRLLSRMPAWLPLNPAKYRRELTRLLAARARDHASEAVTRRLMQITLPPDRVLRLAQDHAQPVPEVLRELRNPELRALVAAHDSRPDSAFGSGAKNWSNFENRMTFISELFRRYQADPVVMTAKPFSEEQISSIRGGRLPAGKL